MFDDTFPHSHETPDELAASQQLENVEKRLRRTEWVLRAATAVCFALVIAVGTTYARTDTFAETTAAAPAAVDEDTSVDPDAVRDLEAYMAVLFEKVSADLDARIKLKADAIVQRASEQSVSALGNLLDRRLATLTDAVRRDLEAHVDERVEERPVKIASGSLELRRQPLREGKNERVERGHLRFEDPFVRAPEVVLGMRLIDLPRSDRPRVAIRVMGVDEHGFDYDIRR